MTAHIGADLSLDQESFRIRLMYVLMSVGGRCVFYFYFLSFQNESALFPYFDCEKQL